MKEANHTAIGIKLWKEIYASCPTPPGITFERFMKMPWSYLGGDGQEGFGSSLSHTDKEARRNLRASWVKEKDSSPVVMQ